MNGFALTTRSPFPTLDESHGRMAAAGKERVQFMAELSYASSPVVVREDLAAAHRRAWDRLGKPGTWWNAETRVAIAAETRHAQGCDLCKQRKQALSPSMVQGSHDSLGDLPDYLVEMIHRIVSDPGRLTRTWYEGRLASGIADTEYVETVGIVAQVTAIDTFCRGIGLDPHPLPDPEPGEPSRYRPAEARQHEAWAPNIAWDEHGPNEADYCVGMESSIRRALTLVPDEARGFFDVVTHQYLAGPQMRDFSQEFRAITHAQIEFLAGRVSALNGCTY